MRAYLKNQPGTVVAIGLALLALLVAGTGTAVAAATVVNIADAGSGRTARVDPVGRLSVAPAASPLSYTSSVFNVGTTVVSSPTAATLVVTGARVDETRLNGTTNGSDLDVYLVQLATTPDGTACTSASTVLRYLSTAELSSGTARDLVGPAQLEVKPVSGQPKYCLGIYSVTTNSVTDSTPYYPKVTWTGYVARGVYTGTGAAPGAEPAPLPPKS